MGLKDSPYHACEALEWTKSVALGDRQNHKITFGWKKVLANFPGTTSYDFQRPWVYKESRDDLIEADLFVYVDDR